MDDWKSEAACKDADLNIFFPDNSDKTAIKTGEVYAKNYCRKCTVAAECLMYAIDNEEIYGVWGSFAPKERTTIISWFSRDMIDVELCKNIVNLEIRSLKAKILKNELEIK